MGPFREYIFEDGPLVTIENNGKSAFCVVKISRLQVNPRKQRNYFTSKISQYTACVAICTLKACNNTLTTDIQCDNVSAPSNGEITSCSSGITGVGYDGDICSFACNTGYELTGNDTRTCQSDGSWSGSDDICRKGNHDHVINL